MFDVIHDGLNIVFVDVTSFSFGPTGFDPTVEEVTGRKEGNEEEIGLIGVHGVEIRVRVVAFG